MNCPAISKIGTALLLFLIPAAVAEAQSKVFTQNGPAANATPCLFSNTTVTCLSVFVVRLGTSSPNDTFLLYDLFNQDLNTGAFQDFNGSGTIPNSAFQAKPSTDSLSVDTSTLPSSLFTNSTCSFDPSTGFTCGPAHGGVVSGTWTEFTRLIGEEFSGTFKSSSPSFDMISVGTNDFHPALANVSVLGATATDPNAQLGTVHNTTISIQVK
jgi:hypothetical protein